MFAELERYKALERDLLKSSIINQFSGLVYVPALTTSGFSTTLQTAGQVTIDVDNALCTLNSINYPAYFIPGYITETAALSSRFNSISLNETTYIDLFDKEILITHIEANLWYPNTYPDSSWARLRQSPFASSFLFHIGSSKVYGATADYYQYNESGLFLLTIEERYKANPQVSNNANVRVVSSSLTYEDYTPTNNITGLNKNTVINYVKRFPNRLI